MPGGSIEQGPSSGCEHVVESDVVGFRCEAREHRDLVHADADGTNDALVTEPNERWEGRSQRLRFVVVRVVYEHKIDVVGL